MARNRTRSSSGVCVVLGQLEDPLVEQDPALLPVQVPVGGQRGTGGAVREQGAVALVLVRRHRRRLVLTRGHVRDFRYLCDFRIRVVRLERRVAWDDPGLADAHDSHCPLRCQERIGGPPRVSARCRYLARPDASTGSPGPAVPAARWFFRSSMRAARERIRGRLPAGRRSPASRPPGTAGWP